MLIPRPRWYIRALVHRYAQLAVVPGTSHMAPLEKPDLVNRIILDFLSDHQPEKMMSLRG
jgi:pimeloyl-ACP methyl ester carboxylesterase